MQVIRLSIEGLKKIIAGEVKEDVTCVVKFYSHDCHLCHNLKNDYQELASLEKYENIHFFAFNVDDYAAIEKQLSFSGVPTIGVVKAYTARRKPKIRIMPDPDTPHEHTWYKIAAIKKFIEEHK